MSIKTNRRTDKQTNRQADMNSYFYVSIDVVRVILGMIDIRELVMMTQTSKFFNGLIKNFPAQRKQTITSLAMLRNVKKLCILKNVRLVGLDLSKLDLGLLDDCEKIEFIKCNINSIDHSCFNRFKSVNIRDCEHPLMISRLEQCEKFKMSHYARIYCLLCNDVIKYMKKCVTVHINECSIRCELMREFDRMHKIRLFFPLMQNPNSTVSLFLNLVKNTSPPLEFIDLAGCEHMDRNDIECLRRVRSVNLDGCDISEDSFQYLSECHSLSLRGIKITKPDAFNNLRNCRILSLKFGSISNNANQGFKHLVRCKKIILTGCDFIGCDKILSDLVHLVECEELIIGTFYVDNTHSVKRPDLSNRNESLFDIVMQMPKIKKISLTLTRFPINGSELDDSDALLYDFEIKQIKEKNITVDTGALEY